MFRFIMPVNTSTCRVSRPVIYSRVRDSTTADGRQHASRLACRGAHGRADKHAEEKQGVLS